MVNTSYPFTYEGRAELLRISLSASGQIIYSNNTGDRVVVTHLWAETTNGGTTCASYIVRNGINYFMTENYYHPSIVWKQQILDNPLLLEPGDVLRNYSSPSEAQTWYMQYYRIEVTEPTFKRGRRG